MVYWKIFGQYTTYTEMSLWTRQWFHSKADPHWSNTCQWNLWNVASRYECWLMLTLAMSLVLRSTLGYGWLGTIVVKTLHQPIEHRYSTLLHLFSSIDLLLDLLGVGLYGCGTLRSNRKGFPNDLLLKKRLGEREYKVRQHKQLTVSLWQANDPVVISTNSDRTQPETVQQKARDGTSSTFCCTKSISFYNTFMEGVDHSDQLRQYYAVWMKGRKYYKYI